MQHHIYLLYIFALMFPFFLFTHAAETFPARFFFMDEGSYVPKIEYSNCAFTPQVARASKWPEVIHFQCEPVRAARFGR